MLGLKYTCLSRQSLDYYNCWQLVYLFIRIFVFYSILTFVFKAIRLSVR